MWTLTKTFEFDAAHRLPRHKGKCAGLHGHTWRIEVSVQGDSLIQDGSSKNMLVDFHDITDCVREAMDLYLDHKFLNEALNEESPTSEFLARWLFTHIKNLLPGLSSVVIWESPTSRCEFKP